MMNAENHNPKQIYFKTYDHLALLENALKYLRENAPTMQQISILGKIDHFYRDINLPFSKDSEVIRKYWKTILGKSFPFGSLFNPEIGDIFVAGVLTTTFLKRIDGKSLGMLSVGPDGIFRGIGATETQANKCIKLLKTGSYLLIMRGSENELEDLKQILNEKIKDTIEI